MFSLEPLSTLMIDQVVIIQGGAQLVDALLNNFLCSKQHTLSLKLLMEVRLEPEAFRGVFLGDRFIKDESRI